MLRISTNHSSGVNLNSARSTRMTRHYLIFTVLGTVLGIVFGAALWWLTDVAVEVEVFSGDSSVPEVMTVPGTPSVGQIKGVPSGWVLFLSAVAFGTFTGSVTGWICDKTGVRLIGQR